MISHSWMIQMDEANLRKAMGTPNEERLPLVIAWKVDNSIQKFQKYLHCSSSDVTEKVNNVQRTLYLFAITTSNHKNVPVVWSYLPSGARWAFNVVKTKAIPALLPRSALNKMQIHFSDCDDKLYDPLRDAIRMGEIFNELQHHLCGFHFLEHGEFAAIKESNVSFAAYQELERRLPKLELACKEASSKEE